MDLEDDDDGGGDGDNDDDDDDEKGKKGKKGKKKSNGTETSKGKEKSNRAAFTALSILYNTYIFEKYKEGGIKSLSTMLQVCLRNSEI